MLKTHIILIRMASFILPWITCFWARCMNEANFAALSFILGVAAVYNEWTRIGKEETEEVIT